MKQFKRLIHSGQYATGINKLQMKTNIASIKEAIKWYIEQKEINWTSELNEPYLSYL